ncbi:hypothetical protein [Pseudogulbenkiania subflava]|uniref:Peptidase MA superfamily protein n=1 Tax=Pseudogulbenkiania subflava DSM 22618 TaxID=1123014 RepID=A0A1Y6BH59_9NEIS|nr:hypothetical protein [Pseudogulbenkiania subflava]SMF11479.1 hypothetical protein SAMN02745746_01410 [Pseudogulbenkiania subflava DSM 22618]
MRLSIVIASILSSLLLSPSTHADEAKERRPLSSKKMGLTIRVEGEDWGRADRAEVEAVLYSAADELLNRFPAKVTAPIVVTHVEGNPVTEFEKGPDGEYLVRLSAKDRRWSQFVYQFAHELCHIMSNYEANVGAENTTKYNQWFEETLCETASLYALKSMAVTWETSAPYPNWRDYAPAMRDYAEQFTREEHRQLPAGTTLAAWLRENEGKLRSDPYLRDKNEVVASLLLPLFEKNPEEWATLHYLNLDSADATDTLKQYLQHWYGNAPAEHKKFIFDVLALLGIEGIDLAPTSVPAGTMVPPKTAAVAVPRSQAGPRGPTTEWKK